MEIEINYSFIIPHRNVPHLLQRCIDSIPKRDDIQIIIVDDNSDPKIVNFECFPGLNEKCVEVYFTKEGKGAGYARNIGLTYAKGKWFLFPAEGRHRQDLSAGGPQRHRPGGAVLFLRYDQRGIRSCGHQKLRTGGISF